MMSYQDKDVRPSSSQDKDTGLSSRIAVRGLLIALALVLSWVESRIPVLIALYRLSAPDALLINIVRILLAGLTFGNMFSVVYSLAGGMLSFLVMLVLKRSGRFHMVTVSITGGVFHNVGQIIVAILVLWSGYVTWYLPVLWISGIAAGAVIGLISAQIVRRLPDSFGR